MSPQSRLISTATEEEGERECKEREEDGAEGEEEGKGVQSKNVGQAHFFPLVVTHVRTLDSQLGLLHYWTHNKETKKSLEPKTYCE